MANYVQQHLESFSNEIAELRRAKLFSDEETKYIIKSRKEFEYKINGVTKNLNDFKDYIKFEKELLKKIGLQRNKLKIADRKSSIEFKIIKRIRSLYEIASQRFSSDFLLNLEYFKFCKVHNFHKSAALALQHLLKVFPDKPEVWQISAGWHAYDRNDFPKAFNVIRKGLSIHKTATNLYLEAIKLELIYFQSVVDKEDKEDKKEAIKELQKSCALKIDVYLKEIFKNIRDVEFYGEILDILRQHQFLQPQQEILIAKLRLENIAASWNVLAQNEFKNEFNFDAETDETTEISQDDRINKCIAIYEEGLATIDSDSEKKSLWNLYLSWLYGLKEKNNSTFFLNLFLTTLEKAEQETVLDKDFYIEWIGLIKDENMLETIIEKATKSLPDSEELWMVQLKYAIIKSSKTDVDAVFNKAKEKVPNSINLWLTYAQYLKDSSCNPDEINGFYEKAIRHQSEAISQHLKPLYLNWIAQSKDLQSARSVFQDLATRKPYNKELFAEMVQLQLNNENRDLRFVDRVYEMACQQFGSQDIDIWLKYCEFSIKCCKDFNKSQRIYANAENSLKKDLVCNFREQHAELLANL